MPGWCARLVCPGGVRCRVRAAGRAGTLAGIIPAGIDQAGTYRAGTDQEVSRR
jgi:hypothetical protein